MNTLFIGQHLIKLAQVESTNSYAIELLRQTVLSEGTVVIADEQTAGRGQRESQWNSQPGQNLTLSILLKPSFLNIAQQFDLTRAMALAVADVLAHYLPKSAEIAIKWPNDLYVGPRKICGMLIENALRDQNWVTAVVGIGLNINQTEWGSLPATSMRLLQPDQTWSLNEVFQTLCACVEARYLNLRAGKVDALRQAYQALLFQRGVWAWYQTPQGAPWQGRICEVSEAGLLVVENRDGEMQSFGFKEIRYLLDVSNG